MLKNTRWAFVGLAVLIGLCIWGIAAIGKYRVDGGKKYWPLGIDLQGGTELTYALDLSLIDQDRAGVAEEVKDIIAKRLNAYGLKELSLSIQGQDQLVIQLPGTDAQSVNDLKFQIEKAGNLSFRLVDSNLTASPQSIEQYEAERRDYLDRERAWVSRKVADPNFNEERPKPPDFIVLPELEKVVDPSRPGQSSFQPKKRNNETVKHVLRNTHEYSTATNTWEPREMVSGSYLSRVGQTLDDRTTKPAVAFELRGEGAAAFAELTGANTGKLLAIVLDDDIMQVAEIQDRIAGSGILRGDFDDDDVKGIITVLRGGSLPTKPTLISESTVGAVLGQDSIESGLRAILVGLLGVMAVMVVYYMVGGMVANVALALNLLLTLSFVMIFSQTLTLPGIAGMLLTLAMAVDANILIFERYREERKRGKSPSQSLSAGYNRAFWVIFDSNLTTIITGYVLFYLGSGPVKGFAITLIAGLFASFFTSVFVTRVILSALMNLGLVKDIKMLEAFSTPRIPFTKHQRPFMMGSAALIAVTWVFVLWRGSDNYGIDFTGGARVTMKLKEAVSVAALRERIGELERQAPELFRDYSVQTLNAEAGGVARRFAILTRARTQGNIVDAQEPAGVPPAPAPAPAPAPVPPAAEAPASSPPPAPAPAPAAASTPTPAVIAAAPPASEPATQVRLALEGMLASAGWLLPPPFPTVSWETTAGGDVLTVEVNLLNVGPEVTEARLKENIDKYLNGRTLFKTEGRETSPDYKGVSIASTEIVARPQPTDSTQVTRFRLKTSAFRPSHVSDRSTTVPTREQSEEAVRDYFRQRGPQDGLEISEPFPQVATVGPKVASGLQADALVALFISVVGIIFYLALRFEFVYGLAGVIALVHDCMVAIGVMAVTDMLLPTTFPVKMNLNELAAVLTIIGFSINDTIVLFDRIRENLEIHARKKLTLRDIVDISVNQTLARTLWTSVTVLFVTVVLLSFGGDSVRGFAYLFAVGTVAGVYSSVFIAAPVVIWLQDRAMARRAEAVAERV